MSNHRLPNVPKGLSEITTALLNEQRRKAETAVKELLTSPGNEPHVAAILNYEAAVHRFERQSLGKEITQLERQLQELQNEATAVAMAMMAAKLDGVTCEMMLSDLASLSVRQMQIMQAPRKLDELFEARRTTAKELQTHKTLAKNMRPDEALGGKIRIFTNFLLEVDRILDDNGQDIEEVKP